MSVRTIYKRPYIRKPNVSKYRHDMRLRPEGNYKKPGDTIYCFNCWYPAFVHCLVCKQDICRHDDCLQQHDSEFEQYHILDMLAGRDDGK